jgi:carotenoid cleavage dioxygenase-like enzyme
VTKLDLQTMKREVWRCEMHESISEVIFAPREGGSGGEDDGYLLTYVFNGKTFKSEVLIFDARAVAKGPVSRLQLRSNVPHSLHGMWSGKVWDSEDILRKFKVASALIRTQWNKLDSGMAPIFEL